MIARLACILLLLLSLVQVYSQTVPGTLYADYDHFGVNELQQRQNPLSIYHSDPTTLTPADFLPDPYYPGRQYYSPTNPLFRSLGWWEMEPTYDHSTGASEYVCVQIQPLFIPGHAYSLASRFDPNSGGWAFTLFGDGTLIYSMNSADGLVTRAVRSVDPVVTYLTQQDWIEVCVTVDDRQMVSFYKDGLGLKTYMMPGRGDASAPVVYASSGPRIRFLGGIPSIYHESIGYTFLGKAARLRFGDKYMSLQFAVTSYKYIGPPCPDITTQHNAVRKDCSLYTCGPNRCGTGGTCVEWTTDPPYNLTNGRCVCNPGFFGPFCERRQTVSVNDGGLKIVPYEDRNCDCAVRWNQTVATLNSAFPWPMKLIGIDVGNELRLDNFLVLENKADPVHYREDGNSFPSFIQNGDSDDSLNMIPVAIPNRIVNSTEEAQYLCYSYWFCDGIISTLLTASPEDGFYIQFFRYDKRILASPLPTGLPGDQVARILVHDAGAGATAPRLLANNAGDRGLAQVRLIDRMSGFDCYEGQPLEANWYFIQHAVEITTGLEFCDKSHRQGHTETGPCCLLGGGTDEPYALVLTMAQCNSDMWPTYLASPTPRYEGVDPYIKWAYRHYNKYGHRKGYSPSPKCDRSPAPQTEHNQCRTAKSGCDFAADASGMCRMNGRCVVNKNQTAFAYPYKCECRKFYGSYNTLLEKDTFKTAGLRRFVGHSCETSLNGCIDPASTAEHQTICNNNPERCVGIEFSVNSTLADSSAIIPKCNCGALTDSRTGLVTAAELPTGGDYCSDSRCKNGNDNDCTQPTAVCVNTGRDSSGNNVYKCQCPEDQPWGGSNCQVNVTSCRPPEPNEEGKFLLCGGAFTGTCIIDGFNTASSIINNPNYNPLTYHTTPWCDCTAQNYTGQYCTTPACTADKVIPNHGYCEDNHGGSVHCYPMWDAPLARCNVSKCADTGGIPADSGPNKRQDICLCPISKETRPPAGTLRPGFLPNGATDGNLEYVGRCFARCPTYPVYIPEAFCGSNALVTHSCVDADNAIFSNSTRAVCQCAFGYVKKTYLHSIWNTTEEYCERYCGLNGDMTDTAAWSEYIRNPIDANLPTCTCKTHLGYYNAFIDRKKCLDFRCNNKDTDSWEYDVSVPGDQGRCKCGDSLYTSESRCTRSACSGPLGGPIRGQLYQGLNDGLNKCLCYPPFRPIQGQSSQECLSDICSPNGRLVNNTAKGSNTKSYNPQLQGKDKCECNEGFKTNTDLNCPNPDAYGYRFPCVNYCQDPICLNGGTLMTDSLTRCVCKPPYTGTLCGNHLCGIHGAPDPAMGRCRCSLDWTDNPETVAATGLQCTQDPCSVVPCNAHSKRCGGTYNSRTFDCDCFPGWGGPSCGSILTGATANCTSSTHGTPVGSSDCVCNEPWSGDKCQTSMCINDGITVYNNVTKYYHCQCPSGSYTGTFCEILIPSIPNVDAAIAKLLSNPGVISIAVVGATSTAAVVLYAVHWLYTLISHARSHRLVSAK
jgi:hypothetical protein